MCDSKGILTKSRGDTGELNEFKLAFARDVDDGGLAEAMIDADVFLGLSKGGLVSGEMVESMAERPLIFALANPDPEILPTDVQAVRDDAIIATGRSDYPNQINNVLGFPYIFRGALDVRATEITEGMKMAATKALAALAYWPSAANSMHLCCHLSTSLSPPGLLVLLLRGRELGASSHKPRCSPATSHTGAL